MAPMTRSKKLDELVSSVEELFARLPDSLTPEVAELRDRVDAAIFEAIGQASPFPPPPRGRPIDLHITYRPD